MLKGLENDRKMAAQTVPKVKEIFTQEIYAKPEFCCSRNRHFSFGSVTVKCPFGDGANKPPKSHNSSDACNQGDTETHIIICL